MTSYCAPVLVAGAGPSGLIAALTLLQNNIPIRIIDKELHHRISQRAFGLWPRTFEVFHFLRVHEIYQRAASVLPVREYKLGTLEPTKTFPFAVSRDPTPLTPYSNLMFLGQPALEGILRSHLEKYGCHVELGTELQSFEDDGQRVVAKLVKRKDGEEISETFEASYLIGTDGAKGVTRKQLGLTFLGETRRDFLALIGDICLEVDGDVVDRKHWHMFGQLADRFSLYPMDDIASDGYQFMLMRKEYEPKQLIADEKLMFKLISELLGHEINVRKIVAMTEFRPNIRMVNKFRSGRVLVAGDAAHVHTPAGGQGLNSSVQDAFNLAWKLVLVYRGLSPITLLDSYTSERVPVIAEMLNITTGILDKFHTTPTTQGHMDGKEELDMLGVNYRTSPIVVEEFTQAEPVAAYRALDKGVLIAGDRAPDAPELVVVASGTETKTETRLFDMFSPICHTVLVFTTDASSSRDILEALWKYPEGMIHPVIVLPQGSEVTAMAQADVVVDQGGYAYQAYLAVKGEQKVVAVRPDGVVGAIVHGAEGLGTYFAKIFI